MALVDSRTYRYIRSIAEDYAVIEDKRQAEVERRREARRAAAQTSH